MHALLRHLHDRGTTGVPVPISLEHRFEEVSYLPGASGADCWPHQATEDGLRSAARLLRRLHDATVGWVPPDDAVFGLPPAEPRDVVCHGDPGPWNMVWADGLAVGLYDWDFCHPGPRQEDVAYALEYLAPFRDDADALRWHGFREPPDRRARIRVFCEEYGISTAGMVDAVIDGQRRTIEQVRTLADAGVAPQVEWVAQGYLDELASRAAWSEANRQLFC